MIISPRERAAGLLLLRMVLFGVLAAVVTVLLQGAQSGSFELDTNTLVVVALTAAATAVEKWLRFEAPDLAQPEPPAPQV